MRTKTTFALMAICLTLLFTGCKTKPPYTVNLQEFANPAFPNLHSYTHATYKDKIVLFGGRLRGLHSSSYAFGQSNVNATIYVIDTHNWNANPATWSVSSRVDTLLLQTDSVGPTPFLNRGQFRANNAEFFTKDTTLYLIGGLLGSGHGDPNPTTLPLFTAINLGALVSAVTNGTTMPASSIHQVQDTLFGITGGEIGMMDNTVYLVFGWRFNGNGYYAHRVNTFTYNNNAQTGLSYTLNPVCPTCWDGHTGYDSVTAGNFRRRDGSMSPMVDPSDGTQSFLYYSGVFKNGNTNFDTPIWIKNGSAQEDSSFHMRSNVYTCMVIPFYSQKNKESYATLLGGMTNGRNSGGPIKNNKPRLMDATTAEITPPDTNNFLSIPLLQPDHHYLN
jgi:hypothetical protein